MSLIVLVMAFALDRLTTSRVSLPDVNAPRVTAAQLDSLRPYMSRVDVGRAIPESLLAVPATRAPNPFPSTVRQSPPRGATRPRAAWRLSAILISEHQRIAVIDELVVQTGDALSDGTRVAAIAADFVDLVTSDGTHHIVRLSERGS